MFLGKDNYLQWNAWERRLIGHELSVISSFIVTQNLAYIADYPETVSMARQ